MRLAAGGAGDMGPMSQGSCSRGACCDVPELSLPSGAWPLIEEPDSGVWLLTELRASLSDMSGPQRRIILRTTVHAQTDRWGDNHAAQLTPAGVASWLIAPCPSLSQVPWFGWENTKGGIVYNYRVPQIHVGESLTLLGES